MLAVQRPDAAVRARTTSAMASSSTATRCILRTLSTAASPRSRVSVTPRASNSATAVQTIVTTVRVSSLSLSLIAVTVQMGSTEIMSPCSYARVDVTRGQSNLAKAASTPSSSVSILPPTGLLAVRGSGPFGHIHYRPCIGFARVSTPKAHQSVQLLCTARPRDRQTYYATRSSVAVAA